VGAGRHKESLNTNTPTDRHTHESTYINTKIYTHTPYIHTHTNTLNAYTMTSYRQNTHTKKHRRAKNTHTII
jgi:hypothetical protein